jgi:hypothetical protein
MIPIRARKLAYIIRWGVGSIPGRLCIGTEPAIIVSAPLTIPDVPMPEMARPMINTLDELATPLIKDPTSKSRKKLRKTTLYF